MVILTEPERRRSARFRRRSFPSNDVKALNDGKEIYEALTQFSDPDALKVRRFFILGKGIKILKHSLVRIASTFLRLSLKSLFM